MGGLILNAFCVQKLRITQTVYKGRFKSVSVLLEQNTLSVMRSRNGCVPATTFARYFFPKQSEFHPKSLLTFYDEIILSHFQKKKKKKKKKNFAFFPPFKKKKKKKK